MNKHTILKNNTGARAPGAPYSSPSRRRVLESSVRRIDIASLAFCHLAVESGTS